MPASLQGSVADASADDSALVWYRLSLSFAGTKVTVSVNGTNITSLSDKTYSHGLAAIGSGWHLASFDDFAVRAT
jgi:hypothetical protein